MQTDKLKTIDLVIIICMGIFWLAVDGYLVLFTPRESVTLRFMVVNLAFLVLLKMYLIISDMISHKVRSDLNAPMKTAVLNSGGEMTASALGELNRGKNDICGLEVLIDHYRLEAQHRRIYFDAQLRSDPAKLRKDDFVLTTIAGNLLNNAFDAIDTLGNVDGPKRILFNCQDCDDGIMISVFNDYPYELRRLLREEILFQEGYTTNEGENRGNGLHIVKEMVSSRDGVIFMDKTEGVEFIVEL